MSFKVSIITVNKDNIEGLKRTTTSVFEQTANDFEYIVIDGGSTDGCNEFLKQNNEKFDYWISEADGGIYNAMNKGIKIARGEYLLFLNSGDHFKQRNSLKEAMEYLGRHDFVYFDIEVVEGEKRYLKPTPEKINFDFLKCDSLPHQSTFIRNSVFKKIGKYDESYKIISDWKLTAFAILKFGMSSKKIPLVLSNFYKDGISTVERDLLFLERSFILKENFQEYLKLEELEIFRWNIKKSKSIKILKFFGFLKWAK